MSLTDIDRVRLRSSDKAVITREVNTAAGGESYWKLNHRPVASSPAIQIFLDGVLQNTGYTVDLSQGIVTFTAPPAEGVEVAFIYYWTIFTDDEISDFISEAGGSVPIATSKVLLAIAADASKIAERHAMAGGGGLGSISLDTSVTSRELRATAAAILDMEGKAGEVIPAEGLTEPIWDHFGYQNSTEQDLLRNR